MFHTILPYRVNITEIISSFKDITQRPPFICLDTIPIDVYSCSEGALCRNGECLQLHYTN
jgi:hypothetical protein